MARFTSLMLPLIATSLVLSACGDDDLALTDAGDAGADGDSGTIRPPAYRCSNTELLATAPEISTTVGGQRTTDFVLSDSYCDAVEVHFSVVPPSLGRVTDSVIFDENRSAAAVTFTADALGEGYLVAYFIRRDGRVEDVELPVRVVTAELPECAGRATGELAPGGSLRIESGGAISIPSGAAREDQYQVLPFTAEVECAADQAVGDMLPVGPAVSFESTSSAQGPSFPRDVKFTLPANVGIIPAGRDLSDLVVSYSGPGVSPRIVPVANFDVSEVGAVSFEAPRLGTYQLLVPAAPSVARDREFTFRALMGISMGSGGTATIGFNAPERFDFLAPLGGPVDWPHMLYMIRNFHAGGFCTAAERAADPSACDEASTERTPDPGMFEPNQDFEHFNYIDEYDGQGGTFDRNSYLRIFRDLGIMYGNVLSRRTFAEDEPAVTPSGIPDSERDRSNADRCNNPVIIAGEPAEGDDDASTGFFDAEFNPTGEHQLITFCDGSEVVIDGDRDIGVWDPSGSNTSPVEVTLAVDINGDGQRNAGEPLIRQMLEPFEDCGLDQLCNEAEAGYDPITNPDPAGDDYDFQYNPGGTEGNWVRDYQGAPIGDCVSPNPAAATGVGERFMDVGLDGVAGTPQLDEGGYDAGESDGCWTVAPGVERMFEQNARTRLAEFSDEILRDTNFYSDGGVRDLFGFARTQDQLFGALYARGLGYGFYNTHGAIRGRGRLAEFDGNHYWNSRRHRNVHFRYGDLDASEADLIQGDGGHVGTVAQAIRRITMAIKWMSAGWPDGDRSLVNDTLCFSVAGCEQPNSIVFDFEDSRGNLHPSTVVLPPGYYDTDLRYPVVYLLHGYGMDPADLAASAVILWQEMIADDLPAHERLQKLIFVFPNGACDNSRCLRGNFFTDAPGPSGGPLGETAILELMDYMDENYRTRGPETFSVRD